jgi:hypothetical protein
MSPTQGRIELGLLRRATRARTETNDANDISKDGQKGNNGQ